MLQLLCNIWVSKLKSSYSGKLGSTHFLSIAESLGRLAILDCFLLTLSWLLDCSLSLDCSLFPVVRLVIGYMYNQNGAYICISRGKQLHTIPTPSRMCRLDRLGGSVLACFTTAVHRCPLLFHLLHELKKKHSESEVTILSTLTSE